MLSTLQRLANRAHVDDSDGFTLIELLIVVVIIGILAAIAIPQFSSTKESAYASSVQSDLRNLMTTQEALYARSGSYGSGTVNTGGATFTLTAVGDSSLTQTFNPSDNVTMNVSATTAGVYTATATHSQLPSANQQFCVTNDQAAANPGQIVRNGSCGAGGS